MRHPRRRWRRKVPTDDDGDEPGRTMDVPPDPPTPDQRTKATE